MTRLILSNELPFPLDEVVGKQFGRWTVIEIARVKVYRRVYTNVHLVCRCSCGQSKRDSSQKIILLNNLIDRLTTSCGCIWEEISKRKKNEDECRKTAENCCIYDIWYAMIYRCYSERMNIFPNYGGRGITVCERWLNSLKDFMDDMGPRPSIYHTLDRINVNGNYEPFNCRWATMKEQALNKRVHLVKG